MKALTLHQPWATLIAQGHKRVENRTWRTGYRGPLAIHAGLKLDPAGFALARRLGIELPEELPHGAIVAVSYMIDCMPIAAWFDLADYPPAFRNFAAGPWCWILADVEALAEPVPCLGRQGVFEVDLPVPYSQRG